MKESFDYIVELSARGLLHCWTGLLWLKLNCERGRRCVVKVCEGVEAADDAVLVKKVLRAMPMKKNARGSAAPRGRGSAHL